MSVRWGRVLRFWTWAAAWGMKCVASPTRWGSQERAVGIDANPVMITEAGRRASGLTLSLSFEVGDAHQVGLSDGAFDCVGPSAPALLGQTRSSGGREGAPDASWRIRGL